MEEIKKKRGRPLKDGARRNKVRTMMNDEETRKLREISKRSGLSQMDIMRIGTGMFINQLEKLYPDVEVVGDFGEDSYEFEDFEEGMYDDFESDDEEDYDDI